MKLPGLLFPIIAAFGVVSCDVEEHPAKTSRPFTRIQSNGGVTFKLVQGADTRLVSTSLNDSYYSVSNGQLNVNAPGGTMTIATNRIDLLWCNACSVETDGPLVMDTLNMYLHAGHVEMHNIDITNYLQIYALNSGSYRMAGRAAFLNLFLINAIDFNGYSLITDSTYVDSQNAFDSELQTTMVLNAFVRSAGNVNYKGNPPIVRATCTSIGKVVKK